LYIIIAAINDWTPPTIHCPQSMTIKSKASSVALYWPEVKAYDNSGQKPVIKCSDNSGLVLNTPSQSSVTCKATDAAGNKQSCFFFIDVKGTSH